jgi:hypothetical protein
VLDRLTSAAVDEVVAWFRPGPVADRVFYRNADFGSEVGQ